MPSIIAAGAGLSALTLPEAVVGGGIIAGGASIASGLIGANAATTAANDQLQAANNATNAQLSIYNQTQQNLAPYNQIGQSALTQLASLFGLGPGGTGPNAATAANATSALTNYPGYQFGLSQGTKALDASAASQGLLLSGNQLQAAQQYGQNYAMANAWQPYLSQLSGLSSLGENAAATAGNQGAQTGQGIASSDLAAGQAAASGIIGSSNALTSNLTAGVNTGLNSGLVALALQQGQGSSLLAGGGNFLPIGTTGSTFGVPAYSPYAGYPEL